MLVLTRKINESIMIGNDIEIKIISVEGDQIKLGIEAPKHVEVHRKEIFLTIQEENKQASVSGIGINQEMFQKLSSTLEKNRKGINK